MVNTFCYGHIFSQYGGIRVRTGKGRGVMMALSSKGVRLSSMLVGLSSWGSRKKEGGGGKGPAKKKQEAIKFGWGKAP